ncbi:AAA family ATPase [Absicoccus porci]|uniref:AAA family ATPase n=1 Tax=Absicoccus porci TaxID=2486576 RepID=UPI002942D06F|nr:AAA family ATPase [Absicoccus porci]
MKKDLFERKLKATQTTRIVEKGNTNQQGSYNLDVALERTLKQAGVIKAEDSDPSYQHFVLTSEYSICLEDGMKRLLGSKIPNSEKRLNVRFVHTVSKDGTTKFQIKRSDNKDGDFKWFSDVYNLGIEGSIFLISIDEDAKILYFNIIFPESVYDWELVKEEPKKEMMERSTGDKDLVGYNKLYYGIPGCGKSYYIEHHDLASVDKKHNVFRTTFYLDYSNSDFIGQIYPVVDGKDKVKYEPVPGPFTKALARAFDLKQKNVNDMVYLVIEEINRGNAAAIFGDTFQLLDRLKEPNDGRLPGDSEYPISNEFIEGYFEKEGIAYEKGQIYIPHNLTILATMNTSDQNVFPLDTAFKRRWNRQLMKGNWENCDFKDYLIPGTDLTWQKFADAINNHITSDNNGGTIMEDKKLGPFFANKEMFKEPGDKDSSHDDDKLRMFIENVMDYLYADVCKFDKEYLFEPNITFDKICELAEHLNGPDPMSSKCLYLKEELFLTEDAVNDDETEEAA